MWGGGKTNVDGAVGKQTSAVQNGTLLPSSPEADRVVIFQAADGTDCSGTLITPNHILTAAHCALDPILDPSIPDELPKNIWFVSEKITPPSERSATVLEVFVNPDADVDGNKLVTSVESYSDVAILKINRRIPSSIAVPKRPYLDLSTLLGSVQPLNFKGFGPPVSEECSNDAVPGSLGTRRQGSNSFLIAANSIRLKIPSSQRFLQDTATPGDSGGPLEFMQGNDSLFIGSISGGGCEGENNKDYAEIHTNFSFESNRKFILSVMEREASLGGWVGELLSGGSPKDPDEDGIPNNGEDNCPEDYNPEQLDADADGLGDVCDPTPLIHTDSQKEPARNSNYGAELVNYERVFQDDRPITKEDLPEFAPKRALHYQVDEVEKIALARASLMQEPISSSLCQGNACALAKGNTRIDADLITSFGFASDFKHGFRFCRCEEVDINLKTEKGRVECDERNICPYLGALFLEPSAENPWKRIHLQGQNFGEDLLHPYGSLQANSDIRFHSYSWDIALDTELWATPPTPENPLALTTQGILWSHTVPPSKSSIFNNQQGDVGPDPDWKIAYLNRSNVFLDGSVQFETDLLMKPPKSEDLFLCPWDFCPHCPVGTKNPFLYLGNPGDDRMLAVSKEILFDVTSLISTPAREILRRKDGFLIPASEPSWLQKRHGAEGWLTVALDTDFSLREVLRNGPQGLQTSGRRAAARSAEVSSASSPVFAQGAVLVGSSSQDAVFRVGGLTPQGISESNLWKLSVSEETWSSIPLVGEVRPGKVLAATYRFSDQSLYVVDEEITSKKKTQARLLRIRRSGLVEKMATWPRLLKAKVTLTVSSLDELVFSFSKAGAHAVVIARVTSGGKFQPTHWTIRPGALLLAPRLSERWMTEAIQKGAKTLLEDVERTKFLPVLGPCGALWW